jgi:hypothetical protein
MAGLPTNGYHPLWMIVLVLWGHAFGFDLTAIRALEVGFFIAGQMALIALRSVPVILLLTLGSFLIFSRVAQFGMESSLFFLTGACFLGLALQPPESRPRHHGAWLFVAAGLAIGTRLDAALFVLPVIALMPIERRTRLLVVGGLALCGAVHALVNRLYFGTALPVSGAIKSLGDAWVNTHLLDQIEPIATYLPSMRAAAHPYAATLGLVLIGSVLSALKLVLGSGWKIWFRYGYPAFLLALAIVVLLARFPAARIWLPA